MPTISSLAAARSLVTAGTATTLTAVFSDGEGSVDHGVGAVRSGVAVSTGNLAEDTTFTLTVSGPGGTRTRQIQVKTVAAPVITSFTAAKGILTEGASATLTGVFTGGAGTVSAGLGSVATGVPVTTAPLAGTATFTLTVTNEVGDSATAQTTVTVVAAPVITGFSALKTLLTAGGATTLTGSYTGGTGLVSEGLGGLASGGAVATGPLAGTTTFRLTVTNAAGDSVSAATTVTVVAAPAIAAFTSSMPRVGLGQSAMLTAVFTGGEGVLDHGLGPVLSGVDVPSGPLAATSLFTLTVTNAAGDAVSAKVAIQSLNRLATGEHHAAVVKSDGTVWTWGRNDQGQLGDGTALNHELPAMVPGLSGVAGIAAGARHLLALKADGTVWAWGVDYLGSASFDTHAAPFQVPGLTGVVDVAGGGDFSLALRSDGTVWSWGANFYGEVGSGAQAPQLAPVQVPGLSGVVAVSAGSYHGLALKADGTVWAWGSNVYGELGDGTSTSRSAPAQVPGLGGVVAVAGIDPFGSMALKSDGTVWVWGYGISGKFGDGGAFAGTVPAPFAGLQGVTSLAGGFGHTVFAKGDGSVWVAGDNSQSQCAVQAGQGSVIPLSAMAGLPACVAVAAGHRHSLALGQDGTLWAWGDNEAGLLGDGVPVARMTAAPSAFGPWALIQGAGKKTLALRADGSAWGWGWNLGAELGDGTSLDRSQPVRVQSPLKVTAVSGRTKGTLILREDGSVWRLGFNPDPGHQVTAMDTLAGSVGIAAGDHHYLALKADGTVWAWGTSYYGELGDGANTAREVPVQVSGLTGITQVAAAGDASYALKSDGTAWTWGRSYFFDGTPEHLTPVPVAGLSQVVALAPGDGNCLALKADGSLWAWGSNWNGELGDGTTHWQYPPVQVPGLGPVRAIASGDAHSLALGTDGTVWAWGRNAEGQLGDGTVTPRRSPGQVQGLAGITAISAGAHHSLALTPTQAFAWGLDDFSQLGLNRVGESGLPLQIPSFRLW
ncbi:RCC1 domain-containing protein [Mesoterricola silvestris]|uniref:RCC1 domain-containing protein n=1 Tax=Mesoterricola silvestris TaxID=2927979 RepID=UPI00292DE38F|nr:hypothetical protein [Mesoterricola silvestris]